MECIGPVFVGGGVKGMVIASDSDVLLGVTFGVLIGTCEVVPFAELGGTLVSLGRTVDRVVDGSSEVGIIVSEAVLLIAVGAEVTPVPDEGGTMPDVDPETVRVGTPDDGMGSEMPVLVGGRMVGMSVDGRGSVDSEVGTEMGTERDVGRPEGRPVPIVDGMTVGKGAVPVGTGMMVGRSLTMLESMLERSGKEIGREDGRGKISEPLVGRIGMGVALESPVEGAVGPGAESLTPGTELGMTGAVVSESGRPSESLLLSEVGITAGPVVGVGVSAADVPKAVVIPTTIPDVGNETSGMPDEKLISLVGSTTGTPPVEPEGSMESGSEGSKPVGAGISPVEPNGTSNPEEIGRSSEGEG